MGNFEKLSVLVIVVIIVMIMVVAIYEWTGTPDKPTEAVAMALATPANTAVPPEGGVPTLGAKAEEAEMAGPPHDPLVDAITSPILVEAKEFEKAEGVLVSQTVALMPATYIQLRVKDMGVGESAWLDSVYLSVTREGKMTLNPNHWITKEADSETDLKITRLEVGFRVDITTCPPDKRSWMAFDDEPTSGWVVTELIGAEALQQVPGAK